MFIQWCVKGIYGIDDDEARSIIDSGEGIMCRWWRNVGLIAPSQIRAKLTMENLERHIHRYNEPDSATGVPFCEGTPFISLTAGCVERNAFLQTNTAHPAMMTALDFATNGFTMDGYLFHLWTVVGLRPAATVEAMAEEVRELNTYTRYSAFQTEGEIVAKIHIPSNQIHRCEKYSLSAVSRGIPDDVWYNSHFDDPLLVSNIRELI